MQLLGKKLLYDFKMAHADAQSQIDSWEAEVEEAQWSTPHDVKRRYPKASIIGNHQVIFNICGDRYRLWAQLAYKTETVLVRKIGTHKEYDKWHII